MQNLLRHPEFYSEIKAINVIDEFLVEVFGKCLEFSCQKSFGSY